MSDHDPDASEPEFQSKGFDAPTGPPTPPERQISEAFIPVVDFLKGIVSDEGLLLDLAFERAMEIVDFHLSRNRVGIDNFVESGTPPVLATASLATPLAVELYKQALASINRPDNAQRLGELVGEARARKSSTILAPS